MLRKVAVQLEGNVDLTGIHRLCIVSVVDEMFGSIQGHRNENGLVIISLKLPRQVVPDVCSGHGTSNSCRTPAPSSCVPDIPHSAAPDIALRAKNELSGPVGLVDVKLKCLGKLGCREVEIYIVFEVPGIIACAK